VRRWASTATARTIVPHLKQVVLGMVLDGDGRPFASFLWPGNTTDVTRLMPVVQRLRERFGIAQVCVVVNRGMIAATIAAPEEGRGPRAIDAPLYLYI